MKSKALSFMLLTSCLTLLSCGDKTVKTPSEEVTTTNERKVEVAAETKATSSDANAPASERVDLVNKGKGPIKTLVLGDIDQAMAAKGQEVFKTMCTACHKTDKKFIGPAPKGILERRTPEWVMNMILNPENMIENDPLAQDLLKEFNGAPMANQNLTEEEARAVLEYFRTL
ncbi:MULTISPECIES: cytochrome c [unclassified Myroides]|uniref:c-type cytochrome n=1 Tax=unclassified Myroides TaxID=2642485 RepID=UPI0015F9BD20|nr:MULTISPECIES: cytochrome c [unclassified Myroides]MBB1149664.1 cytochrome c [Myroides sp. NP-2]MDM1408842.1 cytochrome c [Myroides sp. DF42-4-2]